MRKNLYVIYIELLSIPYSGRMSLNYIYANEIYIHIHNMAKELGAKQATLYGFPYYFPVHMR